MPRYSEKEAELDVAIQVYHEEKAKNPKTTIDEVAKKRGINPGTLRGRNHKAAGRFLCRLHEAELHGYSVGIRESPEVNSKKGLLERAQILKDQWGPVKKPLDRDWLDGFLWRNNYALPRPMPVNQPRIISSETYPALQKFWRELREHSLQYDLTDASQFWYLNETVFYDGADNHCGILGTVKSFDSGLRDPYESDAYPISALVAYSDAGQLVPPTLLFEEEELVDMRLRPGKDLPHVGGTAHALLDDKEGFKWLERFEASSRNWSVGESQSAFTCYILDNRSL